MTKRALVVGINYVGTGYDLRGCINDANNMARVLRTFQFDTVELLLEEKATTFGIKSSLINLIKGAIPGDVLVFHYSGHGSQVPSTSEEDGYDEIICPYDLDWQSNFITDDYLKAVFNSVPNGVNVTVILDSCHSGTSLDQRSLMDSKYISSNGTKTADPDSRGRYLPPPPGVQALIDARNPTMADSLRRDVDVSAVLIATSKDSQLSADAKIDGQYQGAGTYSLIAGVTENPRTNYRDLVAYMNQYMSTHGFTQNPQLNGPTTLYKQRVFEPWDFMMAPDPTPSLPPVEVTTSPAPTVGSPAVAEDKTSIYVLVGFVIFVLVMVCLVVL